MVRGMTKTQLTADARKAANTYHYASRVGSTKLAAMAFRSYERIVARLGYDPLV